MNLKRIRGVRLAGLPLLPMALIVACFAASGLLFASAALSPKIVKAGSPKYVIKNIEDVQVGDWVLAKDPGENGRPTPHRVTALPRNWTEHVVHLRVTGGGEVQATRNHPFYVVGRGWIEARNLNVGDNLRDEHERTVRIEKIWTEAKKASTFNLTVEGVHTYYVLAGDTPVLVHNLNPWDFGNYNDLQSQSSPGDGLQLHHYPQGQPASEVIPNYEYPNGLAVAVPERDHWDMAGSNYRADEFTGDAQQLVDESYANMPNSIPPSQLNALDQEARSRYLPKPCGG